MTGCQNFDISSCQFWMLLFHCRLSMTHGSASQAFRFWALSRPGSERNPAGGAGEFSTTLGLTSHGRLVLRGVLCRARVQLRVRVPLGGRRGVSAPLGGAKGGDSP